MRHKLVFRLLIVALLLMVLLNAACGGTKPETTATTTSQPVNGGAEIQVTIKNLAYHPQEITIHVGDTVIWTNEDSVTHTVTSYVTTLDIGETEENVWRTFIGEQWDSKDIKPGESFSRTFDQTGTYGYISIYYLKPEREWRRYQDVSEKPQPGVLGKVIVLE